MESYHLLEVKINFTSRVEILLELNGMPVSRKISKQIIVAVSLSKFEYIAVSSTIKELFWMRPLRWEVQFRASFGLQFVFSTIAVLSDNITAISIANHDGINAKVKHIEVKVTFWKDL